MGSSLQATVTSANRKGVGTLAYRNRVSGSDLLLAVFGVL
jgi:hypothetical protein